MSYFHAYNGVTYFGCIYVFGKQRVLRLPPHLIVAGVGTADLKNKSAL
jgi:hypothetical protein